jgi:hypothetical protein
MKINSAAVDFPALRAGKNGHNNSRSRARSLSTFSFVSPPFGFVGVIALPEIPAEKRSVTAPPGAALAHTQYCPASHASH